MRRRHVLFAFVVLALTSVLAAAPRPIVVGIVEGKVAGSGAKDHAALIRHLQESKEFAFDVRFFPSFEALYDAFKAHTIDVASFGAVKYVQANHETGAVPIAAEATRSSAVLFVRAGSPIQQVTQLKGMTLACGYPDSTTTFILPMLVFSKHRMSQSDITPLFVGTDQQEIVRAVLDGRAAAGAVAENVFESNRSKLRLLEQSESISGPPIVVQKSIDDATRAKLQSVLLSFKAKPEERSQRFGAGLVAASDADYNKLRFFCLIVMKKNK